MGIVARLSNARRTDRRLLAVTSCLAFSLLLSACSDSEQTGGPDAQDEAPGVIAVVAEKKPLTNTVEFIGRTEAFQSVDLRARVTGFLVEKGFNDGTSVSKGDVLFRIDSAQYDTAVSAAGAGLERAEAELLNARQQLERVSALVETNTASKARLDEAIAVEAAARANVSAARSEVERSQLDLSYTEITTPIDGRIGKSRFDIGNLIGPDSGILATVIAEDPVRVVFSVSEKIFLYVQTHRSERNGDLNARIRLADGTTYPQPGKLHFVDNQVDNETGTIRVYLEYPNPDGILLPGLFVTVLLSRGETVDQIMIPQSSVQLNQSGAFVLVVDGDSKVETRPVKTGDRSDGDVVILEGLSEGETVIVDGIQKVRPGMKVTTSLLAEGA